MIEISYVRDQIKHLDNIIEHSIDLSTLALELSTLRYEMKKEASEPEQDASVGAIAVAESAAKSGNGPKTLQALKPAGNWALEVATEIGATIAAEAIKKSLSL